MRTGARGQGQGSLNLRLRYDSGFESAGTASSNAWRLHHSTQIYWHCPPHGKPPGLHTFHCLIFCLCAGTSAVQTVSGARAVPPPVGAPLAASLEPLAGQGHCREREQAAILEYKHTIQKCRDNGVNASLTQNSWCFILKLSLVAYVATVPFIH